MEGPRRQLAKIGAVVAMVVALFAVVPGGVAYADDISYFGSPSQRDPQAVNYYNECGRYWPSEGRINTFNLPGTNYSVMYKFKLNATERQALSCMMNNHGATRIELDFRIFGFSVPAEWDDYQVMGTNIPGAIHDVAFEDESDEATPGVTNISVSGILAQSQNTEYFVNLAWYTPLNSSDGPPRVAVQWVASYYWGDAVDVDPTHAYSCLVVGGLRHNQAWCVFGMARVFLTYGALSGQQMMFNSFQSCDYTSSGFLCSTYALGSYAEPGANQSSPTSPPPQTLTKTAGVTIWPGSNTAVYQPLKFSYTVKNTSGVSASIARLEVAVRDPGGNAQDVPCVGGFGVTIQPNQTWNCEVQLPQGYGSQGTYTYWADWMGYDGVWHHGQLGGNQTFTLGAANTLSIAEPVSVGPSSSVSKYTPLQWSYRVRNSSGSGASIQKFVVAVRAPDGSAQDVSCQNGTGVSLQPGQEWTCSATLPQGYGSTGNFTFWADWQDYGGVWHHGQLGWDNALTLGAAPTLTTTGALSVGPSGNLGLLQPAYWSYRVKNTSGFATSIKKLIIAVRTPGGGNMDVPCDNGTNVTLAPNEEWTCSAINASGYGSQGAFQFWADWQGFDNAWHTGALSGPLTMNVGPPLPLANDQYITLSPGNSVATGTGLTFTYRVRNLTPGGMSIQKFVVAVRAPNGSSIDVLCAGGSGVALASNALFTCTATVPSGYATPGIYTYWADWQDYAGVWHPTMLSPPLSLYVT